MIPGVLLATQVTGGDIVMLVTVLVLMAVTTFLALAETALTRMSRSKAQALADSKGHRGERLLWLVSRARALLEPRAVDRARLPAGGGHPAGHPGRPLLRGLGRGHRHRHQRRPGVHRGRGRPQDLGHPAPRAFGPAGRRAGDLPGPVLAHQDPVSRPDRHGQRPAAGQGSEGGSLRLRGGAVGPGRRGRRRGRDRRGGARPHRADHRVRRHRRARGHGAPARHDHHAGRVPGGRRPSRS